MPRLILASASPQRKTLLTGLGLPFEVIPSHIDESECQVRDSKKRAQVLSQLKARDIAHKHAGAVIIGCDTLVVGTEGHLLEKPADAEDALRMLQLQSGRTSFVHSGVTVISDAGKEFSGVSSSSVTFKKLSKEEEEWWIGTGLWKDRSGAFQIDGPGQLMIEEIRGDWSGIVGLPVFLLGELLERAGVRHRRIH
ncbi:MAG: septum formation protein Maf [Candidatus Peribacteraceae bacterium]|nr:septum formation protein Maf [Candidatus Peribacteraceae bacterium]